MAGQRAMRRIAGFLHARVPELELGKVVDPREKRGRRWQLHTLLTATLLGLMSGAKSLAQIEELTQVMGRGMRRMLGIGRRVADTTLRDVLCRLDIESLRALLHRAVRAANRRKALPCVGLPFHVAAMDGKATALTSWDGPYAQRHLPEKGKPFGLLRTVTSTLVTTPARPCIDVSPIPSHTNEMGHFQTAFLDLCETYPDLFAMVTYDAGANGEENAATVVRAGKHYLLHMANEERHMAQLCDELLALKPVVATTLDTLNNNTVQRRTLRLMRVQDHSQAAHRSFIWSHTRCILRVDSERVVTHPDGTEVIESSERRLYCSSLVKDELLPAQWLLLVRSHWGVETTHQILDVAFAEDDHPWIENDPDGALSVMVLRRVAYTLLTLFRSVTQRSDEKRSMPWATLLRWIYRAVVGASDETVSGLRQREVAAATL